MFSAWRRWLRQSLRRTPSPCRTLYPGLKPLLSLERLEERALMAAGDLDPTFGVAGLSVTNLIYSGQNTSAVQPADGKIVVAGVSNGATNDFSVARFTADGLIDTTFGNNGVATVDFGGIDAATDLALQADGKIILVGNTDAGGGGSLGNYAVARLNANGTLDTSFGAAGKRLIDFYGADDRASAVAIDAKGRIVVAGLSTLGTSGMSLCRLNSDGFQDSDFDADGKIFFDFAATFSRGRVSGSTDGINDIAIQPDGKIVIAGFTNLSCRPIPDVDVFFNFALGRFNDIDGTLDTSFGSAGLQVTDFLGTPQGGAVCGEDDIANSILVRPNGQIVVAGYTEYGGGGDNFGLAFYKSDGSLDTAFNADGLVSTDFRTDFTSGSLGQPVSHDRASSVTLQADGKIILAGRSNRSGNNDFTLARYNPDGTLDQNFGFHGQTTANFTGTSNDEARNLVIQPATGKIVLAGLSNSGTGDRFALARFEGLFPSFLQFSQSSYAISETIASVTITVLRTVGTEGTVTVNYSAAPGTANQNPHPFDFTATTGTLTFLPGETQKTFTIALTDDISVEDPETVLLTLSAVTGPANLGTPSAAVLTLLDNEVPGEIRFKATSFTVDEAMRNATITVERINGNDGDVTVNFETTDASARAGEDYVTSRGTILFVHGQREVTFSIPINDDTVFEAAESLTLTLSSPTGRATLLDPRTATLTITDNDSTPNIRFVLAAYRDLLGRDADNGGLILYTGMLDQGVSRTQVALMFLGSAEYRTRTVQELYRTLLRREADATGLGMLVDFLGRGGTVEQVQAFLVGSAEYYQTRGGGTNAGFLDAVYQDLLGRVADVVGRNSFLQAFANGASTTQIAAAILSSVEYQTLLVNSFYVRFLRRPADAAGLATFVSLLNGRRVTASLGLSEIPGVPRDEEIIAAIVGSAEYLAKA